MPESSYSSNAAISTLVIVWSSNYSIAASSTVSMLASFTNFWRWLQKLAVVQVSLTSCGLLLCSPKLSRCRLRARAHIHVVLSRKTPLQQQFYSEYLSLTPQRWDLAWVQSLIKLTCFALRFYEALLGLLNRIDNFTWKHMNL